MGRMNRVSGVKNATSLLSLLALILLTASETCSGWIWGRGHGKVLLSDIHNLTLEEGKTTTGRRMDPIPQLVCSGGSVSCKFQPKIVQCFNEGGESDHCSMQWTCKSDEMNSSLVFGIVCMSCEGYDHLDDPYILEGSCGLGYTIERVPSYFRGDYYTWDLFELGASLLLILLLAALPLMTFLHKKSPSQKRLRRYYVYPDVYQNEACDFPVTANGRQYPYLHGSPALNPHRHRRRSNRKRQSHVRTSSGLWWDSDWDYCESSFVPTRKQSLLSILSSCSTHSQSHFHRSISPAVYAYSSSSKECSFGSRNSSEIRRNTFFINKSQY